VSTPLKSEDSQKLLTKYEGILNNLFEQIFQEITQAENADSASKIPDRYKNQQEELVKLITGQFKGDKDAYLQHIKTVVLAKSEEKAKAREVYEQQIQSSAQLKDWLSYIQFEEAQGEFKRVSQLYERAMGSHLDL
jgi:hypothetical protein